MPNDVPHAGCHGLYVASDDFVQVLKLLQIQVDVFDRNNGFLSPRSSCKQLCGQKCRLQSSSAKKAGCRPMFHHYFSVSKREGGGGGGGGGGGAGGGYPHNTCILYTACILHTVCPTQAAISRMEKPEAAGTWQNWDEGPNHQPHHWVGSGSSTSRSEGAHLFR